MSWGRIVLSKEKIRSRKLLQKRWRFSISECRTKKFRTKNFFCNLQISIWILGIFRLSRFFIWPKIKNQKPVRSNFQTIKWCCKSFWKPWSSQLLAFLWRKIEFFSDFFGSWSFRKVKVKTFTITPREQTAKQY